MKQQAAFVDKVHMTVQPFLQDTCSSMMHSPQVIRSNLSPNALSFQLASECGRHLKLLQADSTSSKRKQVIRQLYSVERSVKKNDSMNSMGNRYREQDEV